MTPADQYCGFYWILILALVSLYSIIATVIAIFNWVSYSTKMLEMLSSKYISLTFWGVGNDAIRTSVSDLMTCILI